MPNKLLLDKETLDDPQALADCKAGDIKTLTVTVTVTRDTPTLFEGDVTDVEYSNDSATDQDQETAPSSPSEAEAAPPPAPGRSSSY